MDCPENLQIYLSHKLLCGLVQMESFGRDPKMKWSYDTKADSDLEMQIPAKKAKWMEVTESLVDGLLLTPRAVMTAGERSRCTPLVAIIANYPRLSQNFE